MTTVAWKDEVLAADSRASDAGWISHDSEQKLFRGNGTIYAVTGDLAVGQRAIRALIKGEDVGDLGENARVIAVSGAGPIRIYEATGWFDVPREVPQAWGSGSPPALGALHAGASAVEAVAAAMKVDPHTGGAVRAMSPE